LSCWIALGGATLTATRGFRKEREGAEGAGIVQVAFALIRSTLPPLAAT
jgi:hypothetical protein